MEKVPMTTKGYESLKEELTHLKNIERPSVIRAIEEARKHGDLSENAEYHAAKEKQSFIEGRILELGSKISRAQVIDVKTLSGDIVRFGATVVLLDEETEEKVSYQIVGEEEADIQNNLLSLTAPLARALIGKKKGDQIEVVAPKGETYYQILNVSYS
ncbi:MAG: transcription elongation factor GreA [Alphaproteobacteria bacterium]|nr:transcription elongation factor GreA [Alphaproteobacteria bacterium]